MYQQTQTHTSVINHKLAANKEALCVRSQWTERESERCLWHSSHCQKNNQLFLDNWGKTKGQICGTRRNSFFLCSQLKGTNNTLMFWNQSRHYGNCSCFGSLNFPCLINIFRVTKSLLKGTVVLNLCFLQEDMGKDWIFWKTEYFCRTVYCARREKRPTLMYINAHGKSQNWPVLEVKMTLLVFPTPRVTDHTDFSFSRVERNEVTAYAYLWPHLGEPKQPSPFHSY